MTISRDNPLGYRGFTIEPKLDFGSYGYRDNDGTVIKTGWIVVEDGCNALPGAIWTKTIEQACECIDFLLESRESGENFWTLHDTANGIIRGKVTPEMVANYLA